MLTIIFYAALIFVTFKLLIWGIKAAWGITKVLCAIILFPAFLVCLFLLGFVYVSLLLLVIAGFASFVSGALE